MNNSPLLPAIPYIVALSTGLITIISTVFLYMKQKNKTYLYVSLLLFSMLSKLLYVIMEMYFESFPPENGSVILFLKSIKSLGVSVFLFILPLFINHIMLATLKKYKKIILFVISSLYFINFILKTSFRVKVPYSYVFSNTLFVLILVYCITTVIINLRLLNDKRQKKIILAFLVIVVVFLPITVTDIIIGDTSILLPIYFIIINILGILFCFFYLIPPSINNSNDLTAYLQKKYNITEREKEIISLMQAGLSNNEISDKTAISTSTVEKHINSIYRKLEIKNRVQLINFIRSGMR